MQKLTIEKTQIIDNDYYKINILTAKGFLPKFYVPYHPIYSYYPNKEHWNQTPLFSFVLYKSLYNDREWNYTLHVQKENKTKKTKKKRGMEISRFSIAFSLPISLTDKKILLQLQVKKEK